jgi:hypothetical protein
MNEEKRGVLYDRQLHHTIKNLGIPLESLVLQIDPAAATLT